jgi:hypothetical protein
MKGFLRGTITVGLAVAVTSCGGTPTAPTDAIGPVTGGGRFNQEVPDLSSDDRSFASFAASLQQAVIAWSQHAHSQGDLHAVKIFAFQLLQNFTRELTQLREYAPSETRGANLTAADQATLTQLRSVTGSQLDRVYLANITQLLQAAVTRYSREASAGTSSLMRSHASNYGGDLRRYLSMAQELARRVELCASTEDIGASRPSGGVGGATGSTSGAFGTGNATTCGAGQEGRFSGSGTSGSGSSGGTGNS